MTANEIRKKYLEFFRQRGHALVPSASLLPENDPSSLFTSSGMQPLVPYLMGEKHPAGQRLADSQKCFRAGDIEEVGDNRHNTFFEMLGNWSLGDYFKQEQLNWFWEFLTEELLITPERLYVSVFAGNKMIGIEPDEESVGIWQKIFQKAGMTAKAYSDAASQGLRDGRIFYYDEKKNWWSRSGIPDLMPVGEIGGPDSEVFYDLGAELKKHENSAWRDQPCHINCDCGRFIEIGNSVFIEFIKTKKGFKPLPQKNVDFGGGLERMAMVAQGKDNAFEIDLFADAILKIEELAGGQSYRSNQKAFEVIADHLKGAVFIMGDDRGVAPANLDQGYIVRRLIRRALRFGRMLGIGKNPWTSEVARIVAADYQDEYPELKRNIDFIIKELNKEEFKFSQTLVKGEKMIKGGIMDGETAFNLFQTYGYPPEMTKEICTEKGISLTADFNGEYTAALCRHQELSRTASAGKFRGGLADAGETTKKLHTAAHLLLAALREVLGQHVAQKGSNITSERLRFDFSHGEKLTPEQIAKVQEIVNQAIAKDYPVSCEEMPLENAKKRGALGVFESKYGEKVKVYTVGPDSQPCSREICGGPHASRTSELGRFIIKKEESSSAGVRRIKATLEF
ncbi:MAG: alanine--tRNA ligase [Planctomycetes bacterium]|jgi:alanyl-tRNA synthetase|nr:alanine--tRNA ligase [Planctomycetota bacterium]